MEVTGTVNVAGTVKVDNTAAIANYLDMARNAQDAGNNKEADEYCNRIIEMDVNNWEAWFLKGKAVGWQSTLANNRISESVNAFSKALEFCPDEKKKELGEQCKAEVEKLHAALLTVRVKNFAEYPSDSSINGLKGDVVSILTQSFSFLVKASVITNNVGNVKYGRIINQGMVSAWSNTLHKYQHDNGGHPSKYAWERFTKEGDILIEGFKQALILLGSKYDDQEGNALIVQVYENMMTLQKNLKDSCSYKADYSYGVTTYNKDWAFTSTAKAAREKMIEEWRKKASEVRTNGPKNVEAKRQKEQEKREAEERAAAEKRAAEAAAYWAEHPEEKAALEEEQASLTKESEALSAQIAELEEKKNGVPALEQVSELSARLPKIRSEKERVPALEEQKKLQADISAWKTEFSGLGLFKGKEKKALQARIDEATSRLAGLSAKVTEQQAEVERKVSAAKQELADAENLVKEQQAEFTAQIEPIAEKLSGAKDRLAAIAKELLREQ